MNRGDKALWALKSFQFLQPSFCLFASATCAHLDFVGGSFLGVRSHGTVYRLPARYSLSLKLLLRRVRTWRLYARPRKPRRCGDIFWQTQVTPPGQQAACQGLALTCLALCLGRTPHATMQRALDAIVRGIGLVQAEAVPPRDGADNGPALPLLLAWSSARSSLGNVTWPSSLESGETAEPAMTDERERSTDEQLGPRSPVRGLLRRRETRRARLTSGPAVNSRVYGAAPPFKRSPTQRAIWCRPADWI